MTDDAEMPAALVETLARTGDIEVDLSDAASTHAQLAGPATLATPRESHNNGGYCDNGFFNETFAACETAVPDPDVTICLDDWYNGAWAATDDDYWTVSSVCPAQGSLAMRLPTDDAGSGLWTVAQNTYRTVQVRDGGCLGWWDDCPSVRVDIEQASGDRFQFRFVSNES